MRIFDGCGGRIRTYDLRVMSHKKKTLNQKGGVAKSTTSYNFAACLSDAGKRALLVDLDPQASLTILYGIDQPDELEHTNCDLMKACADDEEEDTGSCILYSHTVDLIPSSIELSTLEIPLYS